MNKHFKRIIIIAVVLITLVATSGIAFAYYDDGYPYPGWTQFRLLKSGKAGNDVRLLQQYLLMTGYAPGTVDGAFGSNTEAAVKRYQRAHSGLTVDGLVGQGTWGNMRELTAQYDEGGDEYSYLCDEAISPTWDWQDRFYHHSDGSWKVSYGNDPYSWSSEVTAWEP